MNKRITSRAIIIDGDSFYAFYRRKLRDGKVAEYYAIPGGGLEEGETLEENVIRELKEEFCVDIAIDAFLEARETEDSVINYYKCKIITGVPTLGGEELERNNENNYYEVRKVKIADLDNIEIINKDLILKAYEMENNK